MPQECVYDQTKLVVISETFRELDLNQRFYQYATAAGFHIHACEGYDPESKGKVEAGVKYVKQNGLYGEDFANWKDLERYMADWLDTIANQREHGTTGKQPRVHYDQAEQVHMLTYLSPSCLKPNAASHIMTRKADKTGLISWQSNKYSVPLLYQTAQVGVVSDGGELRISDLASGEIIAEHSLCLDKGKIFKNRDHYRDKAQDIETLESEVIHLLGKSDASSQALCDVLKSTSPRIYKDQLQGAKQIIIAHVKAHGEISGQLLQRLIDTPRLTATGLRDRLAAYQQGLEQNKTPITENMTSEDIKAELTQQANKALAHYSVLNGHLSGQGESHVVH